VSLAMDAIGDGANNHRCQTKLFDVSERSGMHEASNNSGAADRMGEGIGDEIGDAWNWMEARSEGGDFWLSEQKPVQSPDSSRRDLGTFNS